jgi:hypothetical protein
MNQGERMDEETSSVEQHPQVESKVLAMISEAPARTSELMKQAGKHGLSSADVRETIWSLLDDGRLQLTSDRRLTIP